MSRLASLHDRLTRPRVAAAAALLLGLGATVGFAIFLDGVYPIRQWLALRIGVLWLWLALLSGGCLSLGHLLLVRVLGIRDRPPLEAAVLGQAIGLVAFTQAMYLLGALGLFGPAAAIALPSLMLLAGLPTLGPLVRSWLAGRAGQGGAGPLAALLAGAGAIALALVYLGLLSPDALNYDSTWCHLTVAQDYARAGRIVPFPADYARNVPQLASLVYTWGYLLPGLNAPLRWMLALHAELLLFLWTLAGIVAVVRWMVRDDQVRAAWTVVFLFPSLFRYDNNLGAAADHVLAFFGPPIVLALGHALGQLSRRWCAMLGIVAAGALLTKYQAIYLLAPAAILLAGRSVQIGWWAARGPAGPERRAEVLRLLAAAGLGAGLGLALCAPHFLKNWIFHRNPFYPFMQSVFTGSVPSVPNGAFLVEHVFKDGNWRPPGSLLDQLVHALGLFFSFSFKPHYYFDFHRDVPTFGSLFTLLLPLLLFLGEARRILLGAVVGAAAVLVWGMTFNVDRNLQTFMPVLAAVVAALVVRGWRLGSLARAGLVPLVALQAIWGADAPFYGGADRVASAIELIRSGHEGRTGERWKAYRRPFRDLSDALPPDARVLVHNVHVTLGIDRTTVLDMAGFQGLISYEGVGTPRELHALLRRHGITHVVQVQDGRASSSKQEEVLVVTFLRRHCPEVGTFGNMRLCRVPDEPPPDTPPLRVLALGLAGYADGLYPITSLGTIEALPRPLQRFADPEVAAPAEPAARIALRERADAVLLGPGALQHAQEIAAGGAFVLEQEHAGQLAVLVAAAPRGRTPN